MLKEVEAQLSVVADSPESTIGSYFGLVDGVGAEIGELGCLHVAPHQLDGIEVGGVTRKAFDHQPRTLESDPRHHGLGLVRGEPVPDERDLLAGEVGVEPFEELDQALGVVGAVFDLEHEGGLGPIRAVGQRGRNRQPAPVEVVMQHRSLAFGGPGGPHAWEQ